MKGRPVMLYFSRAKQDPNKIDVEQLTKLRNFKAKTFPNALIETYSDPTEFKGKLSRQLELQRRSLLSAESEGRSEDVSVPPVTDIVLHFGDAETGTDIGPTLTQDTNFIEVTDFGGIPDYSPPASDQTQGIFGAGLGGGITTIYRSPYSGPNKNYFRQLVTYQVVQAFF